jgi:hypothetical protein
MRESGSKMCGIEILDGMFGRTMLTLFLKYTWKHKHLQEGLDQMNEKKFKINPINIKRQKKKKMDMQKLYKKLN